MNTNYFFGKTDEYGGRIQFDSGIKPNNTVYSDRLYQWDYKKYNELCRKHWGENTEEY